jgi:hypothetical protein
LTDGLSSAFPSICERNGWRYFGKKYGDEGSSATPETVRSFQRTILSHNIESIRRDRERIIAEFEFDRPETVLLSNEEFIMKGFRHNLVDGVPISCDIGETMKKLCALFDDSETNVRVLVVVRNQAELVPSLYAQGYQHFYKKLIPLSTPYRFVQAIKDNTPYPNLFSPFYYETLLSNFAEIVGHSNLCVLPFELMRSQPSEFFRRLSVWTGVDCSISTLETANARRDGTSWKTREVSLLTTTRSLRKSMRWIMPSPFRRFVRSLLRRVTVTSTETVVFPESLQKEVHSFFSSSNRSLAQFEAFRDVLHYYTNGPVD